MKWSFRIASVSGIDIRVHASFALIVGWFALEFGRQHGGRGALFGMFLVCAFFLCVVLHELGHSLVAQSFGLKVREIVLLPIGGMARLGREPEKPWQEFLIAIAGPMVNVVIAALLFAVAWFTLGASWLFEGGMVHGITDPSWQGLLGYLLIGNLTVAAFNMIPALPMDGGRVLRSLLAMLCGKQRATSIASVIGQILAATLIAFSLFRRERPDPLLTVIGIFVFLAASQERASVRAAAVLSAYRAADAVSLNTIVLSPGDMLDSVLRYVLRTEQVYFPVVHGEQLLGVLSREDAIRSAGRAGPNAYVAGLIQRDVVEVDANMRLDHVRSRIIENEGRPVVVRGPEGYLGLLSFEDMVRVTRVASRLDRNKQSAAAARSGIESS